MTKNTLRRVLLRLNIGNQTVFILMMISAVYVTFVRLLGPIQIHWDLSVQLDAAHRLAEGLGLTNAFSSQLDLNQPPVAETLTHFPPGLPVLVASFLYFKIPVEVALKIIYGLATIMGWLCWSVIASHCLIFPVNMRFTSTDLYPIIAAILPIFYTPHWTDQGTDILLWAGVPLYVLLLLRASQSRSWIILTSLASVLFITLMTFRYASGFLLPAGLLIIFGTNYPKLKSVWKHYIAFLAPLIAIASAAIWYLQSSMSLQLNSLLSRFLKTHAVQPVSSNLWESGLAGIKTLFLSLSDLYLITGIDIREKLRESLAIHSALSTLMGIVFLLIIILLPIVLLKRKKDVRFEDTFKILLSLSLVLVAFLIFAVAINFTLSYSPLSITRYYWPIELCLPLIASGLLSITSIRTSLKKFILIFLATFLLFNFFARPIIYSIEKDGFSYPSFMANILKIPDEQYPGHHLLTFYSETLAFITSIEATEPHSLFFVQAYPHYISYAEFDDPSRLRRIPDSDFWEHAYLSEPTKIYWVIDYERCPSICASRGNFNSDSPKEPILPLTKLPDLKTIFTSSSDHTEVKVSNLPAGYHFGTDA